MTLKNVTGVWGEQAACRFLVSRGYQIVHCNWRAGHGEIDIIAKDRSTTVFVEVKTRRSTIFGDPIEALTQHKQQTLRQTISAYLAKHHIRRFRVDVISILTVEGRTTLKHLKDIELGA